MTEEELTRFNRTRLGKNDVGLDAAKLLCNSEGLTHPIKNASNLFFIEFQYGSGAISKGEWSYNNLVLQIEDCVDCLKLLYPEY